MDSKPFVPFAAILFLLSASPALAVTPGVEELYQLLLTQQQQLDAQGALLREQADTLQSLRRELSAQKALVQNQQRQILAQKEQAREQSQVVTSLREHAVDTRAELALMQAKLPHRQGSAASTPEETGYAATASQPDAGAMVASLEPVGASAREEKSAFQIHGGAEYLIASSNSFRFTNSDDDVDPDTDSMITADGHTFALGYMAGITYDRGYGSPTWGLDMHYWREADTVITVDDPDNDMSINVGPKDWQVTKARAVADVTRYYADAYGQGEIASASDWELALFAGLRYGYLRQTLYIEDEANPTIFTENEARYWGVGPRLGLGVTWAATPELDLIARADGALLIGNSVVRGTFTSGTQRGYSENRQTLAPAWMFDSQMGMNYELAFDSSVLDFELGLNTEYWAGIPDHARVDDSSAPAYNNTTMLLIGPYFNVAYEF
jgi:hypothetical protein